MQDPDQEQPNHGCVEEDVVLQDNDESIYMHSHFYEGEMTEWFGSYWINEDNCSFQVVTYIETETGSFNRFSCQFPGAIEPGTYVVVSTPATIPNNLGGPFGKYEWHPNADNLISQNWLRDDYFCNPCYVTITEHDTQNNYVDLSLHGTLEEYIGSNAQQDYMDIDSLSMKVYYAE